LVFIDDVIAIIIQTIAALMRYCAAPTAGVCDPLINEAITILVVAITDLHCDA
jgi:hypothetical protein